MGQGGIGAGAGNGGEGDVLQYAGFAAEAFERDGGVDLGEFFGDGFAVEPGEEFRHGRAVACMGCAGACDFSAVFDGFHERDEIGADFWRPASTFNHGDEAV